MRSLKATPVTPVVRRGGSCDPRIHWLRHTSHTYHPYLDLVENYIYIHSVRRAASRVWVELVKKRGKGWQV